MRVTIDLDRDIIIIPDNFSKRLKKKMRSWKNTVLHQ